MRSKTKMEVCMFLGKVLRMSSKMKMARVCLFLGKKMKMRSKSYISRVSMFFGKVLWGMRSKIKLERVHMFILILILRQQQSTPQGPTGVR